MFASLVILALNVMFIRFGVATARRGWLEKGDILNTYTLKEIEKSFGV